MNPIELGDEMWFRRETPRGDGRVADDESGSSPGRSSESEANLNYPFYQASIIMIGSTKTGKSCLVRALTQQVYTETYRETSIAHNPLEYSYVDPAALSMINNSNNKKKNKKIGNLQRNKVLLEFIDISGAEDHTAERQIHCKDADIIVFVYDISDPQSLEDIKDIFYFETCRMKYQNPLQTPHVLVGTKLDLCEEKPDTPRISQDTSMLYGSNFDCWSIQTSAKDEIGISDLRDYLLSLVVCNTPRTSGQQHKKTKRNRKFRCILQ